MTGADTICGRNVRHLPGSVLAGDSVGLVSPIEGASVPATDTWALPPEEVDDYKGTPKRPAAQQIAINLKL
jgi:hypothetical protein